MYRKWYRQGDSLLHEIASTQADPDTLALWYIGQCGFIFKNSATLYIDPILNDLTDTSGNTRRHYPIPYLPGSVQTDYILCTHGHADHLAVETLTAIAASNPAARFIVPGACRTTLTDAGIPESCVISAKAHEEISLPGVTIYPVSAAHPMHTTDESGADTALCYHITMGNIKILHLGDTYLTEQLLEDLQKLPAPHLFLPPINGSDYFRTKRNCIGNLSSIESARLSALLHADLTIPTHFDMIEGNTVDPLNFVRELWGQNPAAKWYIPALGERFIYHVGD